MQIAGLRGPGEDLIVLLVFDIAGDLALIEPAKTALKAKLATLPENAYVGVLRANDAMQVTTDPTPDWAAAASAIDAVPNGSKAGLLDTVQTTLKIADGMAARSGVRTAVLYITDSDVSNYREDFTNPVINWSDSRDLSRRFPEGLVREKISTTVQALAPVQAPFFFVHLAFRPDRLNEAYQNGLTQLATATGGTGLFCRSATEVTEMVNRIVDAVLGHYVAYVPAPSKGRNVEVQLSSDTRALTWRSRFVLQ